MVSVYVFYKRIIPDTVSPSQTAPVQTNWSVSCLSGFTIIMNLKQLRFPSPGFMVDFSICYDTFLLLASVVSGTVSGPSKDRVLTTYYTILHWSFEPDNPACKLS